MRAKQHHQTTQHFDAIAHEHHLPLGARVGEGAHKWREHHIKQGKHGYQCCALPFGAAAGLDEFNGGYKQGVVSQGAEKLRRHDGVKTAFHKKSGMQGKRLK